MMQMHIGVCKPEIGGEYFHHAGKSIYQILHCNYAATWCYILLKNVLFPHPTGVIVKRLTEMYCAIIAFIQAVDTL